jgi:serine phosphatase RsbU (regulator of sigma subunit)
VLASGGHPFPLLRRRGSPAVEVELGGSLVGVLDEPDVAIREVDLATGDVLVLLTDGALEARRDNEMLGVEGVIAALDAVETDAAGVAAAVEGAVVAHTGGTLGDDVAILVLRAT